MAYNNNPKYNNYPRRGYGAQGDMRSTPGNFGSGMKKPVKSFMDLEIYQQALAASVEVSRAVAEHPAADIDLPSGKRSQKGTKKQSRKGTDSKELTMSEPGRLILQNMLPCALGLPHLIAEAHSYRFGTGQDCIILLEKTMVNCNKMMVYLEQVRDICQTGQPWEFFDELIKKYLYIRRKTLNLQRVWKKYIEHPDGNFGFANNKQPPKL